MPYQTIDPAKLATGRKIVAGTHTTVAASDTVPAATFGLTKLEYVLVSMASDQADALIGVTAAVVSNAAVIKTWKHDGSDPTPAAASVFSKVITVIAVGY